MWTTLPDGTVVDHGDLLVTDINPEPQDSDRFGILNPGPDPDGYPGPGGGVGIPDDDDDDD